MSGLVDAFWRAAAYCLHPRVVLWSVAPVLLAGGMVGGLAWWQGEATVQAVRATLDGWGWSHTLLGWLDAVGAGGLRQWIAPLIVLALALPLLVVLALLLVALLMTPAIVALVVARRFPQLERREGAAWWQVWAWSLLSSVLALLVLLASLPLWLLPPVALVLPPLIWGWLTYRVFAYEVLAAHADADERRRILAEHRTQLLGMGVVSGYMGVVPTLIWAFGAVTLVLAPLLLVVSVWLYTLVFAFAAAWFAHYALAALQSLRDAAAAQAPVVDPLPAPSPASAHAPPADVVDADEGRPTPDDPPARAAPPVNIGIIIIGDEILSGKRQDKHLAKCIEMLGERGLQLAWARYLGDDRSRLTAALSDAFDSGELVFSCGGIGATPDDHTRQAAAAALGRPLELHPQARELIVERMREVAAEHGQGFEPDRPDNVHRLNMGVFPQGATLIPNPYNKIPGFSVGHVHFVPGFPVMAWPMIAWVLDTAYAHLAGGERPVERSVIVYGAMEAALTPLMEALESRFAGVRVFSLPSVDHPQWGRHIELGVKGPADLVGLAFPALLEGLRQHGAKLGPELVR